jgi:hypothetical protein
MMWRYRAATLGAPSRGRFGGNNEKPGSEPSERSERGLSRSWREDRNAESVSVASARKNGESGHAGTPRFIGGPSRTRTLDPLIKRPFRAQCACRKRSQSVTVGRYELAVTARDSRVGAVG